jgi:thioredoxin-like negative regulator of GroEL
MASGIDFNESPSVESSAPLEDLTQKLPPELLQAVFAYLPTESFATINLVDRRWSAIVHDLLEPRCVHLLKTIGMPMNLSSPLMSDKLLALLIRENKADPEKLKAFQIKMALALLERLGELEQTKTGRQLYDLQQEICEHLEMLFDDNYKPFTSKYGYDHENGAFIGVAQKLAKLGLKEGALRIARIGSPVSISNEQLEKISLELAKAGFKEEAYQVIEQMNENDTSKQKKYAYINILRELANLGKIDPVAEVFKILQDTENRIEALRYLGRDLKQPQILNTALTLVLNLDVPRKLFLLNQICQDLASMDEFQAAFTLAETIPADSQERMFAFRALAFDQARRGLTEKALACLEHIPGEYKNQAYSTVILELRRFAKNKSKSENQEIDLKIQETIDLLIAQITDESLVSYSLSILYD